MKRQSNLRPNPEFAQKAARIAARDARLAEFRETFGEGDAFDQLGAATAMVAALKRQLAEARRVKREAGRQALLAAKQQVAKKPTPAPPPGRAYRSLSARPCDQAGLPAEPTRQKQNQHLPLKPSPLPLPPPPPR